MSHDPTTATEDARALFVAHGTDRALLAVAAYLTTLGHHAAALDIRNAASDIRAAARSAKRAAYVA